MDKPTTDHSSISIPHIRRVVLIDSPNVGKSVIFNYLTGTYQTVSNYPGTTVEVFTGRSSHKDYPYEVIDTPGINNLTPNSDDETVTRDIVMKGENFVVAMILDAKNLHRGIFVAGELMEAGLSIILILNMMDEARNRGIEINPKALGEIFDLEVLPVVAVQKEGVEEIWPSLEKARRFTIRYHYSPIIEEGVTALLPLLPKAVLSGRSLALMLLSGDMTLKPWLLQQVDPNTYLRIDALCEWFRQLVQEPLGYLITLERMEQVNRLLPHFQIRHDTGKRTWSNRISDFSTQPVTGIIILGIVLAVSYFLIGLLGAGVVVDLLEGVVFQQYLIPFLREWISILIPVSLIQDLLVGPYGLLSMALTYALALILPIITFFFLVFGFLEDSGYLPRLAVMGNQFFKLMDLNGKAALPMILGLG